MDSREEYASWKSCQSAMDRDILERSIFSIYSDVCLIFIYICRTNESLERSMRRCLFGAGWRAWCDIIFYG